MIKIKLINQSVISHNHAKLINSSNVWNFKKLEMNNINQNTLLNTLKLMRCRIQDRLLLECIILSPLSQLLGSEITILEVNLRESSVLWFCCLVLLSSLISWVTLLKSLNKLNNWMRSLMMGIT